MPYVDHGPLNEGAVGKTVRHMAVEDAHVASLGPYCVKVCQAEVSLTILKLTGADRIRLFCRKFEVSIGMHAHPKMNENKTLTGNLENLFSFYNLISTQLVEMYKINQ